MSNKVSGGISFFCFQIGVARDSSSAPGFVDFVLFEERLITTINQMVWQWCVMYRAERQGFESRSKTLS